MADPPSPAQNPGRPAPPWLAELGQAVAESGKPGLATALRQVLPAWRAQPNHPEALYSLGMIANEAGRPGLAARLIERASQLAPRRIDFIGDLGNVLSDMGRFADAEACYRRVLQVLPNSALAYNNLGDTLQQRGDLDQAIESLERAVLLEPDYADAWSNLGSTLEKRGRFADAERSLKQALAVKPDHPQARLNLGSVYQAEGMLAEAITCFQDTLTAHPRSVKACNKLQKVYHEQGRFEDALALNERLGEIAPGNQMAVCAAAFAALAAGDRAEFRRLYGPDRLVHDQEMPPPDGYDDLAAFNQALIAEVLAHPALKWIHDTHDTTKRGFVYGLLERPGPAVAAFEARLRERIAGFIAALPAEPDQPFFGRAPAATSFTLWATILDAGGWHPAHHHENNWLSGVYYAAVPDDPPDGPAEAPGWIAFDGFTQLPGLAGYDDEVRCFQPKPGRLLFFPAYMMHHTRPFHGGRRISLAFDVKPI